MNDVREVPEGRAAKRGGPYGGNGGVAVFRYRVVDRERSAVGGRPYRDLLR